MNKEGFELKSPCMKGSIKIKAPNARIATYGDRFEELKILEEQMLEMSKLPDFGYENDNYSLLNSESDMNPKRNWNVLGSFLESTDKFQTMINYIKLVNMREEHQKKVKQKIQATKEHTVSEVLPSKPAAKKAEKAKLFEQLSSRPKKTKGWAEIDELVEMSKKETAFLVKFKQSIAKTSR